MKKFLSLVMALAMTVSLVTIGAGATEYKDFSDKSEVQYEEAVAVLNKIGIITGYEDGSFKPTGALTRGAAAKIIVSLMIGSEAAANLSVTAAPYKDVPVTNTFAGVISYCKTAGYINGYSDGTFRPTGALTGFAFSKMLLGALGYRGDVEGFTGSGWIMNVSALGQKAGLFNDFATAFKGNDGLTREAACLLALNTLKATEVEYTANGNNLNVSQDGKITGATTNYNRDYVTSNNDKINQNIYVGTNQGNNYFTLEFGEEHFQDLKLSKGQSDDFNRPANTWSLKGVKIGTYAIGADMTFTAGASGDKDSDKVRDMGINGYKTVAAGSYAATNLYVDGKSVALASATDTQANLEQIAKLTANGTLVELFLNDDDANRIDTVVVVHTQLMQVNRVTSTNVTLKKVESMGNTVSSVDKADDAYSTLSGLKADDYVLVTAYEDGSSYTVASVTVPQSVSGNISAVSLKKNATSVNGLTVGGTAYKMSQLWSSEDGKLDKDSASANVQSTVYLDTYGYAIYVTDVKGGSEYILFDESYDTLVDGKIVHMAQGYGMDGAALSLNFGTVALGMTAGEVYAYTSTTDNNAEYKKDPTAQTNVNALGATTITASASNIAGKTFASDVKFIYLSAANSTVYGASGYDLDKVTVKDGVQKVSATVITYVLDKDGNIGTVIVTDDTGLDISTDVLYVSRVTGTTTLNGKNVSTFKGYVNGEEVSGTASKILTVNRFYTFSESDSIYSVNEYTNNTRSTAVANTVSLNRYAMVNENFVASGLSYSVNGSPATLPALNLTGATVVDVSGNGYNLGSVKDMAKETEIETYIVSLVFNGDTGSDYYGKVKYIYIWDTTSNTASTASVGTGIYFNSACTEAVTTASTVYVGQTLYAKGTNALDQVTAVAGGTDIAVAVAPASATAIPVYSFRVTGTLGAVTATTGWYTVAAPSAVTGTDATKFNVSCDQTIAEDGTDITITVSYDGTATTATTITVTCDGNATTPATATIASGTPSTHTFEYTISAATVAAIATVIS